MLTATYVHESFIRVSALCSINQAPKTEVTCLSRRRTEEEEKGKMSVSEAGKKGGAKGGPRVRELIREGKEHEEE